MKPLEELTSFAASQSIPIISTADAHTEDDPEFKIWKPHCVKGTVGQQKASGTLLKNAVVLSSSPGALDQIREKARGGAQIVVEKQMLDCFSNQNLRPLLDLLRPERCILYGVVTELCVRCAAFGLFELGVQVELVTDAIKSLSASEERDFMALFQERGGRLTTASEATG